MSLIQPRRWRSRAGRVWEGDGEEVEWGREGDGEGGGSRWSGVGWHIGYEVKTQTPILSRTEKHTHPPPLESKDTNILAGIKHTHTPVSHKNSIMQNSEGCGLRAYGRREQSIPLSGMRGNNRSN